MRIDDEAAIRVRRAHIGKLSERYGQLRIRTVAVWSADETILIAADLSKIVDDLQSLGITELNGLSLD